MSAQSRLIEMTSRSLIVLMRFETSENPHSFYAATTFDMAATSSDSSETFEFELLSTAQNFYFHRTRERDDSRSMFVIKVTKSYPKTTDFRFSALKR